MSRHSDCTASMVILGPTGGGKTDLSIDLNVDYRIDPQRVRANPRDARDIHYMSTAAYEGVRKILNGSRLAGPTPDELQIEVFPRACLFLVRGQPQVLFTPPVIRGGRRLIEVYGPALAGLLGLGLVGSLFQGEIFVVLLNPFDRSWAELDPTAVTTPGTPEESTLRKLLERRGDTTPADIAKRIVHTAAEMKAWQQIGNHSGVSVVEAKCWPFPEYTYPRTSSARDAHRAKAQQCLLGAAKQILPPHKFRLFRSFFVRDYVIHFACTRPGEPGCGCPDGDFHATHPFQGTYAEAFSEAEEISSSQYRGDFTFWVTAGDAATG